MINKKISINTALAIIVLVGAQAFCAEEPFGSLLSLKDSVIIAYKNNKDIQIQEKEIDAANAGILDATSRFLPFINLNYSYTYNDKVLAENIFSGYNNDNLVGLSLNQNVYNGGANFANFKQAKLGLDVAKETLRAKKLDVEFEIKRLYYGLLYALEIEKIAKETLYQAKAHFIDVRHKFQQGTASRFDLLQSEVHVALMFPDLIRAKNDVKLIKAELNKILSRKVDSPLRASDKLAFTKLAINEDEFLRTAYLNKPEIILMVLGVDINKWSIEMAKAGYRPQIDIGLDYTYRSGNTGDWINGKHKNWNFGVAVTIPIFEGFSTKAKVDNAKASYAQAVLTKENVADQIAVDIRKACLNLRESLALINSQKDNIEQAREALRIAEISYDNGVGTNLDVLDAQVSLSQVQENYAGGIYDYLMAEAFLDRNLAKSCVGEDK